MMLFTVFILILLVNIAVAFWFIFRSLGEKDRLLTVLLFNSAGTCLLLLFYGANSESAYLDIALIFALLSALAGIVFSKRTWKAQ
jgi:multicomponent Na+:H+ antiporter subunit F